MHQSQRQLPWFAFAISAVSAWTYGMYGWRTDWYQHGTWIAAGASLAAAGWVLKSASWSWKSVVVVALVLLVANFTVVEGLAMLAIWSVGGFAP